MIDKTEGIRREMVKITRLNAIDWLAKSPWASRPIEEAIDCLNSDYHDGQYNGASRDDARLHLAALGVDLNQIPEERSLLENEYGKDNVWDTDEMVNDFDVKGFMAPFVVVERKTDSAEGTLEFQHSPRYYYNWKAKK